MTSTATLHSWSDLREGHWDSLFLGNGASINICSGFRYDLLFNKAQSKLTKAARKLFADFGTTNFELVLERLHYARQTAEALGFPDEGVERLLAEHDDIREALFQAVGDTHVRHVEMPDTTLFEIADNLLEFRRVFTTNYDLLPYWSLMARRRFKAFTDFFTRRDSKELTFDVMTSNWWLDRTQIFYLHGGLHLWRNDWSGIAGKWVGLATSGGLLGLKKRYETHPERSPLLVSEGTAAHKRAVIERSGYLSFALQQLVQDTGNMVIIGSSFGLADAHIVEAINAGPRRQIAISIRPIGMTKKMVGLRMAELEQRLERHEVLFFDPRTHPLGSPGLSVR